MAQAQVKWEETTEFLGRNGYFKCSGVDLLADKDTGKLYVAPLTSKGDIGRALIEVPKESLGELIEKLEAARRHLEA